MHYLRQRESSTFAHLHLCKDLIATTPNITGGNTQISQGEELEPNRITRAEGNLALILLTAPLFHKSKFDV